MPTVLLIAPGTPPALQGRSLLGERLTVTTCGTTAQGLELGARQVFDLLVLSGMSVDEQNEAVTAFQQLRRWRLVPVLYLIPESAPGIAIPAGYRPELDGLARGTLQSAAVLKRIHAMAREGVGGAECVVAGPYELDTARGRLRLTDREVILTEREAEILALLLARPNRTVPANEIIERGWGAISDERYLQILRRHVSNIRRKLDQTSAASAVRTVRGAGYRFDVRSA